MQLKLLASIKADKGSLRNSSQDPVTQEEGVCKSDNYKARKPLLANQVNDLRRHHNHRCASPYRYVLETRPRDAAQ